MAKVEKNIENHLPTLTLKQELAVGLRKSPHAGKYYDRSQISKYRINGLKK